MRKEEDLVGETTDKASLLIHQGKDEETALNSNHPTIQDLIDVIEDGNILQNKELSAQLLFLINCFVKMNCKTNFK